MLKTLQGFKDFIMRGNVVDLAVGIVIGAAFTGLVTSFTGSFIEPLIKLFGGGDELAGTWRVERPGVRLGGLPQRRHHVPDHGRGALLPRRRCP